MPSSRTAAALFGKTVEMSDYVQAALPEPKPKHERRTKTFRTHDGRRGNRLTLKAFIDQDGRAYAQSFSGICTPDPMGSSQIRFMMRELSHRLRDWAREHGATFGADGKDFIGGACS
jgi:hypothetical protein